MAENNGNDLEVRIGGDVTGFERAADSAVKHLDYLEKKVVAGTQEIDKRTEALAAADAKYAEQLKRRYDPVYAAQQRYIKELENIRRAEQLGALSAEQTEAAIQRALAQRTNAVQRVIGANNALIASNNAAANASRRFGSSIQQIGFQVGDFATQVASGQGFLRPFIQQGTQLISMFGPWGAVIGAAGAAVGALATVFLDLDKNTEEVDDATKAYEETLKSLQAVIDEVDKKGKTRLDLLKAERDETVQLIRVDMARTQTLLDQAKAQAEISAAQNAAISGAQEAAPGDARRVAQLEKALADSEKRLADIEERFLGASNSVANDNAAEQAKKDSKAGEKAQSEAEKEAERRRKLIRDADNDNAAQQDKDRLAAMKRGEEIIRQDEQRNKKFEQYLTGLERENELLGLSADQRRLQSALMDAQEKKGAALTEGERRRVEAAQAVGEAYRQQQAVAEELERGFERAFDRIGSAITTMMVEGKASFLDLKNVGLAVVSELAQEFIKLATINPLKNALFGGSAPTLGGGGGFLSSLFSSFGGGGLGYGSAGTAAATSMVPSAGGFVPVIHSGGIYGKDPMPHRFVANDTFANAPRFHNGLMPNEFPAILEKGEQVIPKDQVGKGGGVVIIDQRGANAPPIEEEVMTDGRVRLLIREAAPSIVRASVDEMQNRQQRGVRR